MPDSICSFLPWDSSFFGLRIARLSAARLSPRLLADALDWCQSNDIACLYFLADSDHRETVELVESASFRFVDIRLTLALSKFPMDTNPTADSRIRLFQESDLDSLKAIARQSHADSRFYFDGGFTKSDCDRLFDTWIERSCHGWADAVFVAELNGAMVGYCTCHLEAGTGSIGLLAVAPQAHGQSLGRNLVAAAISHVQQRGVPSLKVVTQGRNVRAQQIYQKCGFISDSVMLWYHKWFQTRPLNGAAKLS